MLSGGRRRRNSPSRYLIASVRFTSSFLCLVIAGRQDPIQTATVLGSPSNSQNSAMMMKEKAIAIARQAIKGKGELQKGSPVTVECKGSLYVVTFVHINPLAGS
jgi:hypothetical protein